MIPQRRKNMKFSVFTAITPEYGIDEAVKIVKKTGYDGIEWRVSAPAPEVKPDNCSYETCYWCYNRANMKWTVIRTGHVYGPGSRLGSLPKHGRDENLIEKIKSGQPLELVGGGHFLQHHNFAPDLAELMLSCIGNPNTYGQIFISGGPRAVEARTYYKIIADILGADLKIKEIPVDSYKNEHPEDLPFLCNRIYDLTKLKKAGVKMPSTTLEEGLKLHVESILKEK